MKTRIISGALLICATCGLTACHDDLNVTQPSQLTSRSMWNEESDAETAVNGLYTLLRSTMADGMVVWGELRSNLYKSGNVNDAFFNRVGTNVIMMDDAGTNWNSLYQTVNAANLILRHVPDITFVKSTDRDEALANAYFVRALCYYYIARTWGDAPLLTRGFESERQEDMYPTRTPVAQLFALIESDITEALRLMPPGKKLHQASPAAINMLKADYYLWKASRLGGGRDSFATALAAANDVIGAGYELLPKWADIFRTDNENNNEFILTFPFTVGENVTAGSSPNSYSYYLAPRNDATRLEANGFGPDYVPTGSHSQYVVVTDEYRDFLLSDPDDVRGAASLRIYTEPFITQSVLVDRIIIKFKGSWESNTRVFDNDMPLYRLAEAYLLKAEAANGMDDIATATAALNEVAKRARGIDEYYKNLDKRGVTEAIINESKMEFVAEGKMWWLYLRTNTEFELISTLVGREGEKNVTLWPVANVCITTNPRIEQTEGYK